MYVILDENVTATVILINSGLSGHIINFTGAKYRLLFDLDFRFFFIRRIIVIQLRVGINSNYGTQKVGILGFWLDDIE